MVYCYHFRPKVLCTKAVFYIYIILIVLFIGVIASVALSALVYPMYSLYVGPYLPTKANMHTYSNVQNHTISQLMEDAYVYHNFTTNAMYIPDNYRQLLNISLTEGIEMYSQCNVHIQDAKGLVTILQDVQNLVENRQEVIKTLPPISDILSGLNATFYPYIDYLPIQVPLVKDVVSFFKEGNFSYSALKAFTDVHHIFTRDPLQIRIIEIPDVISDPMSLINTDFRNDIIMISKGVSQNVTDVSKDLVKKTSDVYTRIQIIVKGFFTGEDLHQYPEIPEEFVAMFTILQSKVVYYYDLLMKLKSLLPDFLMCMGDHSLQTIDKMKKYMVGSYFDYFRIHFIYTTVVIVLIVVLIVLFILFCLKGWKLAKETLNYAKSLITAASVETIDAINDFGHTIQ